MIVLRSDMAGLCPDSEEITVTQRPGLVTAARTGPIQRREVFNIPRRRLTLRWNNAAEGDRFRLKQALELSKGVLPVEYTPIGKTDAARITLYFVSGGTTITQVGPESYDMTAELEEAI